MDLNALKDFQLVAAHGGFGKASRASGRSKATLSRRVADLEEALGVRLIERGTHRLQVTEAGALLLRRTEGPMHEMGDAVAAIRDGIDTPRGLLRIVAPILFSQVVLGRLVAQFQRLYPDVEIEATTTDQAVHLVDDQVDVFIRTTPRKDRAFVGTCFARDRVVLAAPSSLPIPDTPHGGRCPLPAVVMTSYRAGTHWALRSGAFIVEPQPVLRLSSVLSVRDAIVAGAGVGLVPWSIIGPQRAQGELVTWDIDRDAVELWAVHTRGRAQSPKVRAFVAFLADYFPDGQFTVA
jgi:DNA-binding transcriptional LysR family regulator